MSAVEALWLVRGSIPIPAEADDSGLFSRVADILEQADAEILKEDGDRLIFQGPFRWYYRLTYGSVDSVDGGEVRRDGAMLRYELSTKLLFRQALIATPLVGLIIRATGFPSGFALAIMLIAICWGFLAQLVLVRLRIRPFLRRAFAP